MKFIVLFFISSQLFAVCSVDIDMGGKKIVNTTMTDNSEYSEVATKSYVDASTPYNLKYATTCVRQTTGKNWAGAASKCAETNSWLPRSILEAQIAGCTEVKGWISHSIPSGDILVSTTKVSGDFLTPVYLITAGGYQIKSSSNTSQFNCVK